MAVSGHYREAFDNREEGIRAIAAWIADPDPAHSRLGPMAIERFGPMAPTASAGLRTTGRGDLGLGTSTTLKRTHTPAEWGEG